MKAVIRTTNDRWIAFTPDGKGWKPLDTTDVVVIGAVDDPKSPTSIEVYMIERDPVRGVFDTSRDAKLNTGRKVSSDFGLWAPLDRQSDAFWKQIVPILEHPHKKIGAISLETESVEGCTPAEPEVRARGAPETVAEIVEDARVRIARATGMSPDRVKLSLQLDA